MKRNVTLEIAGVAYRMNADADEGHLEKLADLVNERVAALGERAARQASPAHVLAIVALGLADDLLAADRRRAEVEDTTRRALASAIARIDRRLASDMEGAASR